LFLNDIEIDLQENLDAGISIDQLSIYLLLFADDAVLISETMEGLQNLLNSLELYCKKWKLYVNIDKTKIVVFRKGGTLSCNLRFTFAGQEIEIVNTFNYLGIVLSSGGSFTHATATLAGKGLRAMNSLLNITRNLIIPANIMLSLFDSYVLSILNYGCEVWGFLTADNIEKVHRKFCKWLLNVKTSTNTLALYSELGRFPLYIGRYKRIVKFWLKSYSLKHNNCILSTILRVQRKHSINICNPNIKNWSSNVKDLLHISGFADVWLYPESVNLNVFMPIFERRLRDVYITKWRNGIELCSSLSLYKELKTVFVMSQYLLVMDNIQLRNVIAKIRLSSHNLLIEVGRHSNIERSQRKCIYCDKNDIEDEFHFILICPKYSSLRTKYIHRYFTERPNVHKFLELLNSPSRKTLNSLAIYCKKAFNKRNLS
jgi:hypothetical protein